MSSFYDDTDYAVKEFKKKIPFTVSERENGRRRERRIKLLHTKKDRKKEKKKMAMEITSSNTVWIDRKIASEERERECIYRCKCKLSSGHHKFSPPLL